MEAQYGEVQPADKYNEELVSNVHPPDWSNPEPAGVYNLVVIGAGTAGLVTAMGAAGLGAKVAIVERHLLGGDCLNVGCVPSKTLIRSAEAAGDIARANELGIRIPENMQIDFAAVMERLRRLRTEISVHDSARRLSENGVDVFFGAGRFAGQDVLEVAGKKLKFKKAVIATGARPRVPNIPGLQEASFLTNETVFSLTQRPQRLAVVGGGPIGCEMAQAFARLGSEVTIIQDKAHLLPREDRDAAEVVERALEADQVKIILNTSLDKVDHDGRQRKLHIKGEQGSMEIITDEILLGVGRAPNVEDLNLEAAGVEYDKRTGVHVNDNLQTGNRNIYAAGDICLRYKFTHVADATARIVIQNALFFGRKKFSSLTIPWCTYTKPEIAHTGMYENEAREKGFDVQTFSRSFEDIDRAVTDSQTNGLIKVHVKKGTDTILGATIVAHNAGDMLNEVTLAVNASLGLKKISSVIHPYPTQAEAIKKIADDYNRTRLSGTMKKWFSRYLSWRR